MDRAVYAAERILKFNPTCAGTFTTLANIYSAKGMWKEAANIRRHMRSEGVVKEAGSSWIKVKDEVTAFVSGDKTHVDSDEIYNVLDLVLYHNFHIHSINVSRVLHLQLHYTLVRQF